jgi:hypothetical protein
MDLRDYNQRKVDERLGRLETDVGSLQADVSVLKSDVSVLKTDVAVLKTDVAVIKASMATKDDIIQLQRAMFALILPIHAVLIVILIFLYNAKI